MTCLYSRWSPISEKFQVFFYPLSNYSITLWENSRIRQPPSWPNQNRMATFRTPGFSVASNPLNRRIFASCLGLSIEEPFDGLLYCDVGFPFPCKQNKSIPMIHGFHDMSLKWHFEGDLWFGAGEGRTENCKTKSPASDQTYPVCVGSLTT